MTTSRTQAAHTHQSARTPATMAQLISPKTLKQSNSGVRLYRLKQVLALIPVSRSSWFAGVKVGRYPRGYSLSPRTTVWRSDDIDGVIDGLVPTTPTLLSKS